MKIEIAEPGRMTQSGSSLFRLIQNHKTPVLDLLVRESIQNSLDAHKLDAKYVTVEFLTGEFNSSKLGNELEGITEELQKRYPNENYQYLAVCDSNTVGLTGEMDVKNVKHNNYGNLLKLVYEICKPQDNEGAGGSWGLGKTVYFRVGIGLVIYYSRIQEEDGKYSSRLAASFVENEMNENAMIPEYKGMSRRGIAWWGANIRENTTVPITDENYINKFLDIFGIKPYTDDKTGTIIIMPYINSDTLLADNRIDYTDVIEGHFSPYWYSSIENYLKISVQRWYAPRLCNTNYQYGAYLRVLVNEKGISKDSMEPVFKVVQALYNRANYVEEFDDILSENKTEVFVKDVEIRKCLRDTNAGNVACVKLTSNVLGMEVPNNKPEPSIYLNCEIPDKSVNRPIVFFVRKPGMIVSYESVSTWTLGIPSTSKKDFIFGVFVLNSLNEFKEKGPVLKLEEYIRKSELADHTSWNDWSNINFNPRIISKIQKSVTKTIGGQYTEENIEHQVKENSELSRYLGELVLPPDGFGKDAGAGQKPHNPHDGKKIGKKFSFVYEASGIRYCANKMIVPMELKTSANQKIRHTSFDVLIDSETGKISLSEWEKNLNLKSPFSIEEISMLLDTIDGEKIGTELVIDLDNPTIEYNDISFSMKFTDNGAGFGMNITSLEEHSMKIKFEVKIHLEEKNVRPIFIFEKGGK